MKKVFLIMSIIVLLLTACQRNRPKKPDRGTTTDSITNISQSTTVSTIAYKMVDAMSFGLTGKVSSVRKLRFNATDSDGKLVEGSLVSETIVNFDSWGHVTIDPWGNEYVYDTDGNFYRGNHLYSTVKRDDVGRIIHYKDIEPVQDNEENQEYEFSYDPKGRLVTCRRSGWTGGFSISYVYDKTNIYPSKSSSEEYYEGEEGEYSSKTNYNYIAFDSMGNWTERVCVVSNHLTEEVWEEADGEGQMIEKTTTSDVIYIEKRTINYYN